ncbi:hypothetical protein GA0070558_11388 [Micromonospora haikouensis]|uniref:Uncharacterized protein n=1 Tax=Micromonospora haikouensis TaxID=686309 RepID=A0A1C4W544_9ACTN|nr:hypothetical protein GA0070558_11388 [Micromonospora haikouensis]
MATYTANAREPSQTAGRRSVSRTRTGSVVGSGAGPAADGAGADRSAQARTVRAKAVPRASWAAATMP